jgi:hypothetical protein
LLNGWLAGTTAVLLAACATPMTSGTRTLGVDAPAEVKRDVVTARAKARWDALIKGDLAAAYAYLSPASRATMTLDLYRAKHRVGLYRSASIRDVSCEREACTVNVTLTYDYKRFKGMSTPLVEQWVIADGQAWFVDRE